ncbi:hypothetical protein RRG08_009261 [Elysia crispata]|uniref:Uncharacterized protein n=1 Tax=Elysia crispata TaxID=231223 RepID=A0AAE1E6R8_9GAST|nr:hypothetical protein RRG08_009261 [Elysia crispata]
MFLGSACPAGYTDCRLSPAQSSLQCFWGRPVQLGTPTVACLLPDLPYNVSGIGQSSWGRPVQLGTPTVACLLPDLPYNVSGIGQSSWVHRLSPVSCLIFLTMFLGSASPAGYTDCRLSPAQSSLQCFWGRPVQLGTPTVACLLPDLPYNVSRVGLSSWVHRLSPVSCPIFLTMFLGSACPAGYTDCRLSPA